jgi:hypothetical protein
VTHRRIAARVDGNHAELRQQAQQLGLFWVDTFRLGKGAPDAFVCRWGEWWAVEIKDPAQPPSKRRLTPDEERWHDEAAQTQDAPVAVVETIDDLLALWER